MEMTVGVRKINVLYTRITDGQMESVMTIKPLRNPREPLLTGHVRHVSSAVQLNDAAAGKCSLLYSTTHKSTHTSHHRVMCRFVTAVR